MACSADNREFCVVIVVIDSKPPDNAGLRGTAWYYAFVLRSVVLLAAGRIFLLDTTCRMLLHGGHVAYREVR